MVQHVQTSTESVAELATSLDMLDRDYFAAIAAHELREPVQAVLSFLNVVLQERVGPLNEFQRDFLATADQAARRLQRRIHDLQLILGVKQEFSLNLEPTNLVKQVTECCQELAEIANSYGVKFETTFCASGMAWILADPVRIDQILLNLIENAIQYASTGSTVFVTVRQSSCSEWCVTVQNVVDNAPQDDPNHWFVPFFRGRSEATAHRDGLGLGLAAVEHLVHAQGGQVMARTDDKRVSFRVTFPYLNKITDA